MNSPVFCTPIDGPLGSLTADRLAGDYELSLSDPTRLGTPSQANPVRISILAADGSAILTQMIIVGLVGNRAFGSIDQGFQDVVCPAGSLLAVTASAAALKELQLSITNTVTALNSVGAGGVGPVGPQGPVGPTGATGPSGPSGLLSASSPLVYDANAKSLALPSLPAPLISGVVSTANLGSGSASATTYLRGDGAWASPPATPPGGAVNELQYNNGSGGFVGTANLTTDGASLLLGGQTHVTNGSISTTGDTLSLSQTGDTYGRTSLAMVNRSGANGVILTSAIFITDLIFVTQSPSVQSNLRFTGSGNGSNTGSTGGEFSFVMNSNYGGNVVPARFGATSCGFQVPSLFTSSVSAGTPLTAQAAAGQTAPTLAIEDSAGNLLTAFGPEGGWRPASLDDGSAPSGTLYYSTTAGRLVFKDASGVINPLY